MAGSLDASRNMGIWWMAKVRIFFVPDSDANSFTHTSHDTLITQLLLIVPERLI